MSAFVSGWLAPFRGWVHLLQRPRLWPLAAIPILLNVLVLVLVAWGWIRIVEPWMIEALRSTGSWWESAAEWIVRVLLWIAMLPVLLLSYLLLAGVLGGPFNEALSFRVAKEMLGDRNVEAPQRSVLDSILLAIRIESGNLLVSLVGAILAVLISLSFPPIGPIIGTVISWWLAGYPFLSYPFDIRGRPLRSKLNRMSSNILETTGFGLAVWLLLFPIVTLPFVAPCAVVGATLLHPDGRTD